MSALRRYFVTGVDNLEHEVVFAEEIEAPSVSMAEEIVLQEMTKRRGHLDVEVTHVSKQPTVDDGALKLAARLTFRNLQAANAIAQGGR